MPRIEKIQAKHQSRHEITIDKLTDWLEKALHKAMGEAKGASAAVSAVMGIGKLHGLIVDKKEVTRKRDGADLSLEELYAIAGLGRPGNPAPAAGTDEPDRVH
jgi:hypothetical protein